MAWKLCVSSSQKTIQRKCITGNTREDVVYLDAFILGQWPFLPWWFFPIFRLLWATYFASWLVVCLISFQADKNYKGKWFIYLTNWAFVVLVVQSICLASVVMKYTLIPKGKNHFQEKRNKGDKEKDNLETVNSLSTLRDVRNSGEQEELETFAKITWIMDNIASTMAIGVTISFWGFLYSEDQAMSAATIHTHGVNAAYILLDLCLCKRQLRWIHFYQPVVFGLVYVLFTIIYFLTGGTDSRGRHFIYPFLNWEKPISSLKFTAIFAVLLAFIIFFVLYAIYRIRQYLYWRVYQRTNSQENSVNHENNETETTNVFTDIKIC